MATLTLGTTFGNAIIDHMLRNQAYTPPSALYLSLHTADPSTTGASEATGGSYGRQSVTLAAAASKATTNSGDVTFTLLPAATITHVGVWTASSGGTFVGGGALTASKTTSAGDTLRIPSGDLDLTV